MCQAGVNMGVGATRHRADLRALARKAAYNSMTATLKKKIEDTKYFIQASENSLVEHLEWCEDCQGKMKP